MWIFNSLRNICAILLYFRGQFCCYFVEIEDCKANFGNWVSFRRYKIVLIWMAESYYNFLKISRKFHSIYFYGFWCIYALCMHTCNFVGIERSPCTNVSIKATGSVARYANINVPIDFCFYRMGRFHLNPFTERKPKNGIFISALFLSCIW